MSDALANGANVRAERAEICSILQLVSQVKYSDNHGYGEFWKSDAADDTTYAHRSLK
jgi:hypothetical protein